LQEVLIGTPRASAGDQTIENILIQLRMRQVAREQVTTYQEQEKAAVQERTLNEAKATAAAQTANGGLIPTAMLSSMFGRMMPDALAKLKEEAPKTTPRGNNKP
jgi:hypothetical protein